MDVIAGAKLAGIVVAPWVDIVIVIDDCDVACTKLDMSDRVLKRCFHPGAVNSRLEPRGVFLHAAHYLGYHIKLLDKSVSRPSAHRPSPEKNLVPLIDESKVLRVTSYDLINVFVG